MVRTEGAEKRSTARFLAFGVNGLSVALMIVVFSLHRRTDRRRGRHRRRLGRPRAEAAGGRLRRPGRAQPGRARPQVAGRAGARAARRRAGQVHSPARRPRPRRPDPGAAAQGRAPRRRRSATQTVRGADPLVRLGLSTAVRTRRATAARAHRNGETMTSLLEGAKKLVSRSTDIGVRIEGLEAAIAASRGRLPDDDLLDESQRDRRPGLQPAVALGRPHGRRDRRRDRLRQVLDVQRADRPGAVRGRRPPPHDVVGHGLRVGRPRAPRTCSTGWASRRGTGSCATRCSTPAREDDHAARRGAARPARPRLDRGLPPPRGRPARPARRPDDLGAGPAEVRRRRGPRPLPRPARHAPRRDAGRAQPRRRRAAGPASTRCSPTYAGCSTPTARRASRSSPTSARTGEGIDALRDEIASRVAAKKLVRARLEADLRGAARRIGEATGSARRPSCRRSAWPPSRTRSPTRAGVPTVVDGRGVLDADARRPRHRLAGGLVVLQAAARPAQAAAPRPRLVRPGARRAGPDLGARRPPRCSGRGSTPPCAASPTTWPADLSRPWAHAVREASLSRARTTSTTGSTAALGDTDLGASPDPGLGRASCGCCSGCSLLAALAGAGLARGALRGALAHRRAARTPDVAGYPLPLLLLVGGVVLGILFALSLPGPGAGHRPPPRARGRPQAARRDRRGGRGAGRAAGP